jgi:hypothetical protein
MDDRNQTMLSDKHSQDGPINLRVDLIKAQTAPHHVYFIRLLWAMNDLLSGIQIRELVERSKEISERTKLHLYEHTLRLQQAHLVEACKSFVYLINKNENCRVPIYDWILERDEIRKKYQLVRDSMKLPIYRALRDGRDEVISHYNHDAKSTIVLDAFEQLGQYCSNFKTQDGSNDLNLIQIDDESLGSRYFLADHLMRFAWMRSMNCGKERFTMVGSFQIDLLGRFTDFAQTAFMRWILENGLRSSD